MNRTARSRVLRAVFPCLVLAACAFGGAPVDRATVLVMGDSVMAWNRTKGAAVSNALSDALDVPVATRAVPGASLLPEGDIAFAGQIGAQLPQGRWDWIVLNGGANDLNTLCGCERCDGILDALLSADATQGAWVSLLADVRPRARTGVAIVGYYGPSDAGSGSYGVCSDELRVLEARLARLAARTDGVRFVDVRPAMTGPPENYAPDMNHPSPRGSALIAGRIAAEIGGG